ncbi:MAG: hypothetical protein PHV73_05845 [Eubacteriales bacterium]|nr:hypothetical protein [Eubacteriales bacterium]
MKIEYFHASKFGNGEKLADEFKRLMSERGITVNIHHMRDIKPKNIPEADLYIFSSPGRLGKPPIYVRRFLQGVELAQGSRYAILNTQGAAGVDKRGELPTDEELSKLRKMLPIMRKILDDKDLHFVASEVIDVFDLKGPMEEGWEDKVEAFVERVL